MSQSVPKHIYFNMRIQVCTPILLNFVSYMVSSCNLKAFQFHWLVQSISHDDNDDRYPPHMYLY